MDRLICLFIFLLYHVFHQFANALCGVALSIGEVELLILSAALHDIGMVYDATERQNAFDDKRKCKRFLHENCPELIGVTHTEWGDDIRQWYLRTLHPFRLYDILNTEEWNALFNECPNEVVPKLNVIAVCQSHGEDISSIKSNNMLKYLPSYETEPLFCAMLLRLADLLDFDDTRAPQILFKYAVGNNESAKEWRKHMSSTGFKYPQTPSRDELVFSAVCKEPGVEYSIRDFLGWINSELNNCNELQRLCRVEWQQKFPFPRSVSGNGIISDGYVSDKFMLTMDQTHILKLLTGENLYDSNDVFIRELLQNAIDATLLRGKLDSNFNVENARIDLWEWNDDNGNVWFRIDDQGTGMTPGMLKKYFLKVGNSYYTSKELKSDLVSHGSNSDYFGISRFGIGFLSCFLCGTEAEVSTLYFDDNKSKSEYDVGIGDRNGYGLRMQITGLSGYYTLKSQSENHIINSPLPAPEFIDSMEHPNLEYSGYRSEAGTSIVIKLDPGKLGAINLKASAEKYIYGTRMPVFYNGRRIGFTYLEIMEAAHELDGENVYELSDEEKEEFDNKFPNVKGQYPKIVTTVVPFDTNGYQVISNFSGFCVKSNIHFDNSPKWQFKDQTYTILSFIHVHHLYMYVENVVDPDNYNALTPDQLLKNYDKNQVFSLKKALDKFEKCPVSAEELGDVWQPFAGKEDIFSVWRYFVDKSQFAEMYLTPINNSNTSLNTLTNCGQVFNISCFYQGVFSDRFALNYMDRQEAVFFLENELQPIVDIGRTKVLAFPLNALMAICGILYHPNFDSSVVLDSEILKSINNIPLLEWRCLLSSELGRWVLKTQNKCILQIHKILQSTFEKNVPSISEKDEYNIEFVGFHKGSFKIIYKFVLAYFQDIYDMKICYEDGQSIVFTKKENTEYDDYFDKFPPMMFCRAGSDKSRKYLCCGFSSCRRCITLDHPFAQWLIENAIKIESHFPRQFQQIVDSLCNSEAKYIINIVNGFRQQIAKLNVRYGIDLDSFPELTDEDFWYPDL